MDYRVGKVRRHNSVEPALIGRCGCIYVPDGHMRSGIILFEACWAALRDGQHRPAVADVEALQRRIRGTG